jgi:ABC-type oligopeptide transport system ATPase subunit
MNYELFIVQVFSRGSIFFEHCANEKEAIKYRNMMIELGSEAEILHKTITPKMRKRMNVIDAPLPAKTPPQVTDWRVVYTETTSGRQSVAYETNRSRKNAEKWLASHPAPVGYVGSVCDNLTAQAARRTHNTIRNNH